MSIDAVNADFYGRFQYPWAPHVVERIADPNLGATMLRHSIGLWNGPPPAEPMRIWVAGCGTNQAALTAMRFPNAHVIGSDVSGESLRASRALADQLGIENLELRHESLNEVTDDSVNDYVLCTGVIHHNADPQETLTRVERTLAPDGILELMVYNRYHCIETTAMQQAVQLLAPPGGRAGLDVELDLAVRLAHEDADLLRRVSRFYPGVEHSEAALADALIQPVEYTFTVSELDDLAIACGLHIFLPCVNQLDVARQSIDWELDLRDERLRDVYESLPDVTRWQVTNLFLLDRSPMLWFFLRPNRSSLSRASARAIARGFAETALVPTATTRELLVRDEDGTYHRAGEPRPYPERHPDPVCRHVVELLSSSGGGTVQAALDELGHAADLPTLSRLRARLTTSLHPYLRADPAQQGSPSQAG